MKPLYGSRQVVLRRTGILPMKLCEYQTRALCETTDLYSKAFKICFDIAWEMEKPNKKDVPKRTYKTCTKGLGLKSQYSCSVRDKAVEAVKSIKALAKKGKKVSKPEFSKVPLRIDKNTFSFDKTRSVVSIATQRGRIKAPLHWHKQAMKYIDWICKAGEIGLNRNGKWELRLVFEKTVILPERTGKVVGIDIGIKNAIVTSENKFIGQKDYGRIIRKHLLHTANLQKKGTKSAKRHLKSISCRWRRFGINYCYIIAKKLLAGLEPGDTLVCEDLTGIRDHCGKKGQSRKNHSRYINRWDFKRLQKCIISLAELKGVYVEFVDPRYTSQTCSRCGVICKSNRKNQSFYSCSCGCKLNADLNAARNIAYKWCMANGYTPGPFVNRPIVATAFS